LLFIHVVVGIRNPVAGGRAGDDAWLFAEDMVAGIYG
jgi:hypothetical protein